jgi:Zn-dependent protease
VTENLPGSALRRLQELEAQRTSAGGAPDSGTPRRPTRSRRGLGGGIALVVLLLWKSKVLLLFALSKFKLLLAGLKLLKLGKLLTTGWTMVLSMWVYSMYFGAPFAIGFVLLILIHELGHGLAAKLTGLPVGAPVFIPFFGAMIALKEAPRTTFQDFIIGVGGPAAGTLGGLACLALSFETGGHGSQLLYALGYFTLVINLFNLIPVWQLDGARIAAPFRVSMWALAVALLAVVTFTSSGAAEHLNPLALFVLLAGAYRLFVAWRSRRPAADSDSQSALRRLSAAQQRVVAARDLDVSDRERWISWVSYVALASLLIVLVHGLHAGLPVVG